MSVRFAVIGLWGHEVYAQEMIEHPETELVAVAGWAGVPEDMAERLQALAAENGVPYLADHRQLLRQHRLDAAVAMVPPQHNAEVCAALLTQGVSTLSEKPIADSFAAAETLATAARASGAWYTTLLPMARFDPCLDAGRGAVAEGRLGAIEAASFTYLQGYGPRYLATTPHFRDPEVTAPSLSGGEAAMFSGYGIVALESILGARITAVRATAASDWYPYYRESYMEDLLQATLTFVGGAVGSLTVGRTPLPRPGLLDCVLIGSAGYWDYRSERDGGLDPGNNQRVITDFVAAVRDDRSPLMTVDDTLATIEVLSALYHSCHLGQEVEVVRLGSPGLPAG